jgi:hypothetical protein
MTCGRPGCCDSSKLKHARRHHQETGHPLIRSIEPAEFWAWCYFDKAYLTEDEYLGDHAYQQSRRSNAHFVAPPCNGTYSCASPWPICCPPA